ncbi:MAG: hypothetical protein ACR2JH_03460 [Solirubrobacteraceae bacterium]
MVRVTSLLAGLLVNAIAGWWWADPLVALAIGGVAVREAREAWVARAAAAARR